MIFDAHYNNCVHFFQGDIFGRENAYDLDASHTFPAGKPIPVSGNTAAMLGEGGISWLSARFKVQYASLYVCRYLAHVLGG